MAEFPSVTSQSFMWDHERVFFFFFLLFKIITEARYKITGEQMLADSLKFYGYFSLCACPPSLNRCLIPSGSLGSGGDGHTNYLECNRFASVRTLRQTSGRVFARGSTERGTKVPVGFNVNPR